MTRGEFEQWLKHHKEHAVITIQEHHGGLEVRSTKFYTTGKIIRSTEFVSDGDAKVFQTLAFDDAFLEEEQTPSVANSEKDSDLQSLMPGM
ncbi:hypothetical protein PoB_002604100 [Plakobranchus ocellatus]|uniref:Uncharacterized protein n=1 Tax=Plakobranchus ocellatus TaxID=259542 RepID=A0AAV3ZYD2_9GAST|nr:hypothetical protein PoB_002604100 [Plakobranchus ocellatus]